VGFSAETQGQELMNLLMLLGQQQQRETCWQQ
jgi:hypothetical protein